MKPKSRLVDNERDGGEYNQPGSGSSSLFMDAKGIRFFIEFEWTGNCGSSGQPDKCLHAIV